MIRVSLKNRDSRIEIIPKNLTVDVGYDEKKETVYIDWELTDKELYKIKRKLIDEIILANVPLGGQNET